MIFCSWQFSNVYFYFFIFRVPLKPCCSAHWELISTSELFLWCAGFKNEAVAFLVSFIVDMWHKQWSWWWGEERGFFQGQEIGGLFCRFAFWGFSTWACLRVLSCFLLSSGAKHQLYFILPKAATHSVNVCYVKAKIEKLTKESLCWQRVHS